MLYWVIKTTSLIVLHLTQSLLCLNLKIQYFLQSNFIFFYRLIILIRTLREIFSLICLIYQPQLIFQTTLQTDQALFPHRISHFSYFSLKIHYFQTVFLKTLNHFLIIWVLLSIILCADLTKNKSLFQRKKNERYLKYLLKS